MEPTIVSAEVSPFKVKAEFSDGTTKVLWRKGKVDAFLCPADRFIGLTELAALYKLMTGFPERLFGNIGLNRGLRR